MVGSLDGTRMLIALIIGIVILVFLVLKTKVHAFLAMLSEYEIVDICRTGVTGIEK